MFSSAGKLDRLHMGNEMFSQRMFLHENREILKDIDCLAAACHDDAVAENEATLIHVDTEAASSSKAPSVDADASDKRIRYLFGNPCDSESET